MPPFGGPDFIEKRLLDQQRESPRIVLKMTLHCSWLNPISIIPKSDQRPVGWAQAVSGFTSFNLLSRYLGPSVVFPEVKDHWIVAFKWKDKFFQFGKKGPMAIPEELDELDDDDDVVEDLTMIAYDRQREKLYFGFPRTVGHSLFQVPIFRNTARLV